WLVDGSGWFVQVTENPTYEGSLASEEDWRESDLAVEDLVAVPVLLHDEYHFGSSGGRIRVEVRLLDRSAMLAEDQLLGEFALDVILDRGQSPGAVEITAGWDGEIRRPPVAVAPAGRPAFIRVESGTALIVRLGLHHRAESISAGHEA